MKIERKPTKQIQCGRVVASIWFNPTSGNARRGRYSVSFSRLHYRDQFVQVLRSYEIDDLADLRKASVKARRWIAWDTFLGNSRKHLN